MNGLHGIISLRTGTRTASWQERRMPTSIPFGPDACVVDFTCSQSARRPASPIGVVLHNAITRACLTTSAAARHRTWRAKLRRAAYPAALHTRAYRSGEFRKMRPACGVRFHAPQGIRQDYVVLSDAATLIINLPLAAARGRVCRASGGGADITTVCTLEQLREPRPTPHARKRRHQAGLVRADHAARPPLAGDLHSQQAAAAHARGRVLRAG